METNVVVARFTGYATVTDMRYRWDYGQKLKVEGIADLPDYFEVHFSNAPSVGTAKVWLGQNGVVDIPDEYLATGEPVYAWIFLHAGETDGETVYSILIPVKKRPKPVNDAPTPVQKSELDTAIAILQTASATATEQATIATGAATTATEAAETATSAVADVEAAATRAEQAAEGAEASATDAQAAARSAELSAQTAQLAKSAAETAAANAEQSATDAGNYAGLAEAAEQDAQAAKTAAEASATAAAASETAAQTAQTAAEAAKDTAVANATTATTKAAEAAQSASSAADSETAAEAAATRAEQAAASLTVDSALSETSKNPVQNKVVTGAVADLKSELSNLDDGYASIDKLGLTWASGGLSGGSLVPSQKYRVSMTDTYTATKNIFVKIASGFKIGLHVFSDASTFSYDYGWKTNLVRIDSGTIFKMVVARVSENTSEKADINEFTSALKIYADIGEFALNNNDELTLKMSQETAREAMTFTEVNASDITLVEGKLIHKNNLVGNVFGDQVVGGTAYFYTECSDGDVFEIGFRSRDADRYHIEFVDSNGIILDAQVRGSGSNYVYTDYVAVAPIGATRIYVGSTSNTTPNAGGINTLKRGHYDIAKASAMGYFFTKGDYFYVGDRIDITAKHGYTFENIGIVADHYTPSVTFISKVPQGMGIYNGKAVCFMKNGGMFVWDIESKSVDLELAIPFLSTAHCNSVSFGDFYDASDDFPLIYLSECLYATDSKCFVIRLTGGVATLIQTITYSNDNSVYTGAFDWIVDTDNSLISTYGNSSNEKHTICTFNLPSFNNGDITLTASDIIDSWLIEDSMGSYSINVYQGHALYNGMLFLPDGAWANNTMYVFDMYAHTLRNIIPCNWRSNEFEDVDIYDGKLIIYSGSIDYGRFDAITFKA